MGLFAQSLTKLRIKLKWNKENSSLLLYIVNLVNLTAPENHIS